MITRETLTSLGSSIEEAMEQGGSEHVVHHADDGSQSLPVILGDHASHQDTARIGAAGQSRSPGVPGEEGAEGRESELGMEASSEMVMEESSTRLLTECTEHTLLLPEQALALLERTHPSNASASTKERQKMKHTSSSRGDDVRLGVSRRSARSSSCSLSAK